MTALNRYNVYARSCPARQCFERLAERWVVLIIGLLRDGEARRFNEIKRQVDGISQKVLSQKLKQLERDGMIARQVFATMPITVEYQLTSLGLSFADTIELVGQWAESNVEQMLHSQQQYDQRQQAEKSKTP
ncbi:HxlR family transcriptional regulator [Shewanella mangrovi]|uniref:HxlR family transcriptional regulator n=1 Tax=Shewanella mangrovi TaxID=1515746 RepID=A0A094JW94_9GAMM|nr:helix-turn-helix domain-containing protein [Shewanella mangrovi]KFZ36726.1 HxlR family transcriptional regulator [Shewanella mangrovi]